MGTNSKSDHLANVKAPSSFRYPLWVNRVALTARRSLPALPDQQTFSGLFGMSQKCHSRHFAIANFIEKASQLYEQKRSAVLAATALEMHVRLWIRWARSDCLNLTDHHEMRLMGSALAWGAIYSSASRGESSRQRGLHHKHPLARR